MSGTQSWPCSPEAPDTSVHQARVACAATIGHGLVRWTTVKEGSPEFVDHNAGVGDSGIAGQDGDAQCVCARKTRDAAV